MKKLTGFVVGALIGMAVIMPLAASAQTADSSSPFKQQLIALYTQLIQLLEQELAALQAAASHGASFTATPTSGSAPLAVNFSAANLSNSNPQNYFVDFGDGTTGSLQTPAALCVGDCLSGSASHTYAAAGTYTARLGQQIGGPTGPSKVFGTVTITVTGGTPGSSFTATPTSGTALFTPTFTWNSSNGNLIRFGDGATASVSASGSMSHTYTTAGTYNASLFNSCDNTGTLPACAHADVLIGTATITVTNNQCTLLNCAVGSHPSGPSCSPNQTCVPDNSSSFTATPNSGSAPLAVEFDATVLSNTQYAVDFGDGTSPVSYSNNGCLSGSVCPAPGTPLAVAHHTYTSAGTYTARLESNPCPGQACLMPVQILGTATITVTGAQSSSFTATPTSGQAPLTVTFSGEVPGTSYNLNFGDGSPSDNAIEQGQCPSSNPNCLTSITVNDSHTYTSAGTYTATLSANGTVTTATITVADGPHCSGDPSCQVPYYFCRNNALYYKNSSSIDSFAKACSSTCNADGSACAN